MIKLGRLRLDNFKSFEKPFLINMRNIGLLILDGPNGFGKTTLFDAIELCFTGKISRLVSTDGKVKRQHLLKYDDSRPTSIFLELITTEETSSVIYAHIPASVPNNEKKVSNLSVKISLLKEWPSSFEAETSFIFDKETSLPNLIGNENLPTTFNIFNYVQQEDACHFLKNKEVDRHNKISFLFGTEHKHEEKEKINIIKDQLSSKINSIRDEIQEKNTSIDIIKGELLGIQTYEGEIKKSIIEKIPLIHKVHDKLLKNLSGQSLKTINADLDNLLWIQSNPNAFNLAEFNHKVNAITSDNTDIIDDILIAGHITNYDDILKLKKHLLWVEQLEKKLEDHSKITKYIDKDHHVTFTEQLDDIAYLYPYKYADFETQIAKYKITRELMDDNSKAIKIILDARESLNSAYIKHLTPYNEDNPECPFCGNVKKSLSQLELEYKKQTEILSSINLSHLSQLGEIENHIFTNLIVPCGKRSKRFISKYERFVHLKPAMAESNINKKRWLILRTTMEWLNDNNIPFYHLIKGSTYEHIGSKKNLLRHEFINLLKEAQKTCDEDYTTLVSSLNRLGLSKSKEGVFNTEDISVEISDTQMCLHYMQYLTATYNTESIATKVQEIHNLETRADALNNKLETISSIHKKYATSIKSYEKEVAKSIAIPFFVYSSKILQTRSDGNGAHLQNAQNDRENGFLRFVSNVSDEHDAWNTMSSGQLSGLVISFMFAMNKVYPTNLSTILIDDPVHTMDDINFASFVELLRNEFHSSQIIISTHENKVASYFSNKYSNKGVVKTVNMKQERLYSDN